MEGSFSRYLANFDSNSFHELIITYNHHHEDAISISFNRIGNAYKLNHSAKIYVMPKTAEVNNASVRSPFSAGCVVNGTLIR